jgi:hypothetical protein
MPADDALVDHADRGNSDAKLHPVGHSARPSCANGDRQLDAKYRVEGGAVFRRSQRLLSETADVAMHGREATPGVPFLERFNDFAIVVMGTCRRPAMNIFPYRIARLATVALLSPAAQTFGQGLPGQGASPTTVDRQDPQDMGAEVSFGGQEVKRQIAAKLAIAEAEVPLAIYLPIELSKQVCSQEVFEARAANRSCTATKYIPEFAEAARDHPQTSAVPDQ